MSESQAQPTEPIMQFFACEHLPEKLQAASRPFGELAQFIVTTLPRNAHGRPSQAARVEGRGRSRADRKVIMRKTKLVDCDPRWATESDGVTTRYLIFDCPEGHSGCKHSIPFTPSLEGAALDHASGYRALWTRIGDTFETLTLSPSIRRIPRYASKQAALDAGCLPDYVEEHHEDMTCALHIFVKNGEIEFCGDSK